MEVSLGWTTEEELVVIVDSYPHAIGSLVPSARDRIPPNPGASAAGSRGRLRTLTLVLADSAKPPGEARGTASAERARPQRP